MLSSLIKRYSHLLVEKPFAVLAIVLIITVASMFSASLIEYAAESYEEMLPEEVESVQMIQLVEHEFGIASENIAIVLEIIPRYGDSDEIKDIRDPRVMLYLDLLEQKIKSMENVIAVSSPSSLLKQMNNGYLPKNKVEIIRLMEQEIVLSDTMPSTLEILSLSAQGLGEIQSGIEARGLEGMSQGLEELTQGLYTIQSSLGDIQTGTEGEAEGLDEMSQGLEELTQGLYTIQSSLGDIQDGMSALSSLDVSQLTGLLSQTEALVQGSNATEGQKTQILGCLAGLGLGIDTLVDEIETAASQMSQGIGEVSQGIGTIGAGLEEIGEGSEVLQNLSAMLGEGIGEISQGIGTIGAGLEEMENGTSQFKSQFAQLNQALGEMKSGLEAAMEYEKLFKKQEEKTPTVQLNRFEQYVSSDYSLAVLRIQPASMNEQQFEDFVTDVDRIIKEESEPAGLEASIVGSSLVFKELQEQIGPTMSKTATASLIGILLIVILLFFSIRYGVTSLLAIAFGVVWGFGLIPLFGIQMTSATAGGIAMVMGIGIDFGIQIVTRFRQELRNNGVEKALTTTLSNVIEPMTITTIAILIGFRAMSLGRLTFLGSLGDMLSIGVLGCFFAAITVIPVALVLGERYTYNKKAITMS